VDSVRPRNAGEGSGGWELILEESLHCFGTCSLRETLPGSSGLPVLKWLLRMRVQQNWEDLLRRLRGLEPLGCDCTFITCL